MNARTIPRTAVHNYLRLVRLPLDTAIGLLPRNGNATPSRARLALDRTDASVRGTIATVLGDSVLRKEAEQRRAAAKEHERALRLRSQAQRKTEQADSRLQQSQEQAELQREEAQQRAAAARAAATGNRNEKTRGATETERMRVAASRKATARANQAVDGRAPRARLKALEANAGALREKERAFAASDEARRLRQATGRTKAKRKKRNT